MNRVQNARKNTDIRWPQFSQIYRLHRGGIASQHQPAGRFIRYEICDLSSYFPPTKFQCKGDRVRRRGRVVRALSPYDNHVDASAVVFFQGRATYARFIPLIGLSFTLARDCSRSKNGRNFIGSSVKTTANRANCFCSIFKFNRVANLRHQLPDSMVRRREGGIGNWITPCPWSNFNAFGVTFRSFEK